LPLRCAIAIAGWATAAAIADANNETVISSPSNWFLIVDDGPSLLYIDRLTVNNWGWTGNGTNGTINVNSGDCVGNWCSRENTLISRVASGA
jgi:hypothetical protein